MIKRIAFFFLVIAGLFSCKDDDNIGFDVPVEFQSISFKPVPGGAVMHYVLPDDLDIFGVRARYTNAYGEQLVKDGSYLSDTLLLSGFTEARTAEPVQLTFFNSELQESAPVEMTFDTEASAAVAVFDKLTVNPFWGGFNVTYETPQTVEGTIHVFYIGTNPATQQLDSILMGSYPIMEGGDTLNFEITQKLDVLNVVVRTDDYDGHRVKLQVYENIPSLVMDTLAPADFDFRFTGDIKEEPQYGFSEKYLFDGKKKGDGYRAHFMEGENKVYDTFMAGPEAFGKRFIFDLGTPKVPAALLGYAFLNFSTSWPDLPTYPDPNADLYLGEMWHGYYFTRLPSKAKVYGTNENPETVDLSTCALLYTLDESNLYEDWRTKSWCKATDHYVGSGKNYRSASDTEFAEAEPICLRMLFNYSGESYRYLILVVEDTYNSNRWGRDSDENPYEYVTFDEIEVLVKAE